MNGSGRMGEAEPSGEASSPWRNRRKRIVAREVATAAPSAEVSAEMALAAGSDITTADFVESPRAARGTTGDSQIVDPTQLVGVRHRRHGANVKYRATQVSAGLSFLAAAIAIACILIDEPLGSQILAAAALLCAVVAIYFVRTSRLSHRLRGYAAAAGVLAVIALIASFCPSPFHDDGREPVVHQSAHGSP